MPTATLKHYYQLTKPGIIRGNLLTAAAGFWLAAQGRPQLGLLAHTLIGLALVVASASVFNNYLDRHLDQAMARTQQRALARGLIAVPVALGYASLLGLTGLMWLGLTTNPLTVALAAFGHFAYVVLYGWAKRHTVHGTLVGSLSGAVPPVLGYTAVTNQLDLTAMLLFIILAVWQMPHFYAIALYRLNDYRAAHLPVLPVVQGTRPTQRQILAYIALFLPAALSLSLIGRTGLVYTIIVAALAIIWLRHGLRRHRHSDPARWGREMFRLSLLVITGFCLALALNPFLP